jgi:hypothetical protein
MEGIEDGRRIFWVGGKQSSGIVGVIMVWLFSGKRVHLYLGRHGVYGRVRLGWLTGVACLLAVQTMAGSRHQQDGGGERERERERECVCVNKHEN